MGARKQLNQILIQNFYVYHENWSDLKLMKRGFIKNQKLLVDNQVAALHLSSDVNDERCFSPSFLFFIRFPFCGSPHALSSCHLCRHLRTTLRSFLIFMIIWLFSVQSHVWKIYSPDFKAPFWHFTKKSKKFCIYFYDAYSMKNVSETHASICIQLLFL